MGQQQLYQVLATMKVRRRRGVAELCGHGIEGAAAEVAYHLSPHMRSCTLTRERAHRVGSEASEEMKYLLYDLVRAVAG